MFKRILNNAEQRTHEQLRAVCSHYSAQVFAKLRLADVLPIESSGISNEFYRFALQSHFDFVVANHQNDPLFAVEFDGPSHSERSQIMRDRKKNELCRQFSFPFLRIDAHYLDRKYDKQDLLSRFVEVWFRQKNRETALERGDSYDEVGPDPSIWALMEPREELRRLHASGKCVAAQVPHLVGNDNDGNYDAIGCIRICENRVAWASARMRGQQFPVRLDDILDELIFVQTVNELKAVTNGASEAIPLADFQYHVDAFLREDRVWLSAWIDSTSGQITWLETAK